jgi:hypothetical protein
MDWSTVFWGLAAGVAYAVGKSAGRRQAREDQPVPVRVTLELDDQPIGGLQITAMRVGDQRFDFDPHPPQ